MLVPPPVDVGTALSRAVRSDCCFISVIRATVLAVSEKRTIPTEVPSRVVNDSTTTDSDSDSDSTSWDSDSDSDSGVYQIL